MQPFIFLFNFNSTSPFAYYWNVSMDISYSNGNIDINEKEKKWKEKVVYRLSRSPCIDFILWQKKSWKRTGKNWPKNSLLTGVKYLKRNFKLEFARKKSLFWAVFQIELLDSASQPFYPISILNSKSFRDRFNLSPRV